MRKNVTISAEEGVLRRAREVARRQGTTLNEILRRYLLVLAGRDPENRAVAELMELLREHPGRSSGRRPRREDAYEGRT